MQGLNSAFTAVYWLLLVMAVAALVITLVMSLFGSARFALDSASLARLSRVNKAMSLDAQFGFASLFKNRANPQAHDPYLVSVQGTILNGCFYVLTAAVCALGLHIGLAMALYIYCILHGIPDDGGSFAPDADLLILATLVVTATMVTTWVGVELYNKGITNAYQSMADNVDAFNALVYGNAYANAGFLEKLLGDDPAAALATVPETASTQIITQAVFTINLWQYFRDRLPDAHPSWESIKRLFTVDALNSRKMDVTPFVSASLYAYGIPNRLFDVNGRIDVAAGGYPEEAADAVTRLMTRANQLLHSLDPSEIQSLFGWYLLARSAILTAMVGGTIAYFARRPASLPVFLGKWVTDWMKSPPTTPASPPASPASPASPPASPPAPPAQAAAASKTQQQSQLLSLVPTALTHLAPALEQALAPLASKSPAAPALPSLKKPSLAAATAAIPHPK